MVKNWTGSKITYMIANNVCALTTSHQMLRHVLLGYHRALSWALFVSYYMLMTLPNIDNQNCNIFVDDAMIYSFGINIPETESKLQCTLNTLTPWYSANRLSISAQKSAVMLKVKHSNLAVSINGNLLEQVCSTKYLGVTVDSTLSWDSQCDNLCCKLAGKIAALRRIWSFVKTETLKLLYEKTIQPVMDYTCSVWCHTKKSNINKLQRVQNYASRILTGNFNYLNTNSIDLIRALRWANVQERCD